MNIAGLQYIPDFLSPSHEHKLLNAIDASPWLDDLKRRVQHYGYKYDYKTRSIDSSMFLGDLPTWAQELASELRSKGLFPEVPDQVIVNEYEPGQGISPHVDCEPCFGDTIASITLGSGCEMKFSHIESGAVLARYLSPRSIIILADEARYDWRHSIPARRSDTFNGETVERARRVSLTFRTVLIEKDES